MNRTTAVPIRVATHGYTPALPTVEMTKATTAKVAATASIVEQMGMVEERLYNMILDTTSDRKLAVLVENEVARALRSVLEGTKDRAPMAHYEHREALEAVAEELGIVQWDEP